MKIAYLCEPQYGGTYTFFRRLRSAMVEHDIDFRCVPPMSSARFAGTPFEDEEGVDYLQFPEGELPAATEYLIDHLEENGYALAMVLPGCDILTSNLPRFMPGAIRTVMRVPMMTRGAYAPTCVVASHLNKIFAVSRRIHDDLVRRYHISEEQIETIYHGVDPAPFWDALEQKSTDGVLRLLYAGRLWDLDKGVFLLPEILRHLRQADIECHLTVAGSGPDHDELRRRFEAARVSGCVTMTGSVPLERMGDLFRLSDIFVFPSRFEGCGFAVLEAMAAACAPVVSDIRGSLRVILDDGACGRLIRVGDAKVFAAAIMELAGDRSRLKQLQAAARERVLASYTLDKMARAYAESFRKVMTSPDWRAPPIPIDRYDIPGALQPTWRTRIPKPIKNFARKWMERMGISS